MKISIRELKKYFVEKFSNDNVKDRWDYFYFYESENSNLTNQLELEGYLCLHRRNYKTILVDETGWIYVEFLDSNSKDHSKVCSSHFLSRFALKSFNLFYEHFVFKTKNNNKKCEKYFLYIQTDLVSSEIRKLNWSEIESMQISCEESRIFFLITQELVKTFACDAKSCVVSNKANNDQTTKYNDEEFRYIFKVLNKGPVHSLANSQFKSKLRCDICIEIAPFIEKKSNQSAKLIISFCSKFLFHINILHSDKIYLLKTDKELEIFSLNKSTSYQAEPALIFFQNSFKIIEEFTNPWDSSIFFGVKNPTKSHALQGDFLNSMKATLIEKKLVPSFFQPENDFDDILVKHYDLILPNKQLKLVVKTLDTNETVSIFFDTRFSIFPLCILPGIEIEITDLIRKGDGVFKSNCALKPMSPQSFDLLNPKKDLASSTKENSTKKKSLIDSLTELDYSFSSFYDLNHIQKREQKEQILNFRLLFQNSEFCQEQCGSFVRIYGQIVKIYELNLRLRCKICSSLISSCICSSKTTDKKMDLEFSTCLLVDDHSSIVKLCYSNSSVDLKSKQSNFFHSISGFLHDILNSLNEIKMIPVPVHLSAGECNPNELDRSAKIYQIIKEKLVNEYGCLADRTNTESNRTINSSILNSTLNAQDSSYIFENVVKLDIYKTLYDYLNFTIVDKHFLFYIDVNNLHNMKEIGTSFEKKSGDNHKFFKIGDLCCNEQFKSILNLKCSKFLPVEIELTDF